MTQDIVIPADLKQLSDLLDSKFKGPFGYRFGWDGIIGLIPGVGDIITSTLSFYIVVRGAALGLPTIVVLRMCLNVLVETVIGLIPFIGNIFDFTWKSNSRNLELIQNYEKFPSKTKSGSKLFLLGLIMLILLMIASSIITSFYILNKAWIFLQNIILHAII